MTVKSWVRLASDEGEIELRASGGGWQLLVKPKNQDHFSLSATGNVSGTTSAPLPRPDEDIEVGTLRLNASTRQVSLDGSPVHLTPKEFAVLQTMIQQPSRVFSAKELDPDLQPHQRGPYQHLSTLRKKLGEGFVFNRRNHGWSLLA